jgi:Xaa-Pro aminopeptidase
MQNLYPNLIVNNLHPLLGELRSVKHEKEVALISEALAITKTGIETLMQQAKPGMREYALEAHYNFVLNTNGVTPSFNTIAASGSNATILHYEKNDAVMKDNDLILFDLGVKKDLYCSDISRTFPVNGKFTARQKQIYEIVLEANKKSIDMLKPGVTFKEFNDFGRKILAEGLMKIGKINTEDEVLKYYYHSLGHFLGLDVHDVGNYTKPFEKGQILTVEPGLYLADEGIGIRIEDNILLTEQGHINLSQSIIKEIVDIESFMSKK